MVGTLSRITTLLLAAGILLIGHGLQLTLLPVYASAAGWSTAAIGITGSAYFLGFVAGCIVIPGIVGGVGHIRSFMVMAAITTVALLGAGLFLNVPAWILFRFASGFALSGLYMVIESWLSDVSPTEQRGTVLAIYTMISLLGMALGQILMIAGTGTDLFMFAAVLMSLAIVPIGLTRVASPHPIPSITFSPTILLRVSRVSVFCACLAGMVTGAFWTLGPILGSSFGLDTGQVGIMMSLGILGGAVSQLPVGRLSDLTDRRIVIGGISVAGALVAVLGVLFTGTGVAGLYGLIFLLGAATMPLYALCIAHASDNAELSLVEIASGVLIVHSAGSIVGPIVVATLMDSFGPGSFFWYALVCLTTAALWAFYRRFVVERPREHEEHAALLPRTTHAVAELSLGEPSEAGAEWKGDK